MKETWEVLSSQEFANCQKGRKEGGEEESIKIHSVMERFSREAGLWSQNDSCPTGRPDS